MVCVLSFPSFLNFLRTKVGDRVEHRCWRSKVGGRVGTVQYITTDRMYMVIEFDIHRVPAWPSKIEYRKVEPFELVVEYVAVFESERLMHLRRSCAPEDVFWRSCRCRLACVRKKGLECCMCAIAFLMNLMVHKAFLGVWRFSGFLWFRFLWVFIYKTKCWFCVYVLQWSDCLAHFRSRSTSLCRSLPAYCDHAEVECAIQVVLRSPWPSRIASSPLLQQGRRHNVYAQTQWLSSPSARLWFRRPSPSAILRHPQDHQIQK